MSTSFRPQSLIHAHLPSPPSVPYAIPELRVPSSQTFASTSHAGPLHSQHAQSAAISQTTGLLGRIILNGYGLELRNFDLTIDHSRVSSLQGSETIRVIFPDPLRHIGDDFALISARAGRLFVFVLSTTDTLYRLNFPLGTYAPGRGGRFLFKTEGAGWCEEWKIPEDTVNAAGAVGCWRVLDEAHLVLGTGDGGIVKLSRSSQGSWSATHHRANSRLRLGGLFGRTSDEQVVSLALHRQEDRSHLLYALSRDYKLRIWNPVNGSLLRTIEVVDAEGAGPGGPAIDQTTPLLSIVSHPSRASRFSHLLIVYLRPSPNSNSSGSFAVYRASGSELSYAGEKAGPSALAEAELRGFAILAAEDSVDGYRLQTAWDHEGRLVVETIGMDDIFQFTTYVEPPVRSGLLEDWQQAHTIDYDDVSDRHAFEAALDDLLAETDSAEQIDIAELFIAQIFRPGRFSRLTLQTALDDYIRRTSVKVHASTLAAQAALPTLPKKYAAVVGSHIHIEQHAQTGAAMIGEYKQALKQEWLGVWAVCRDLDRQARFPLSASSLNGSAIICSREGFATTTTSDLSSILNRAAADSQYAESWLSLPARAIPRSLEALEVEKTRTAVVNLLSASHRLLKEVNLGTQAAGERDLDDSLFSSLVAQLSGAQGSPVEAIAAEYWEEFIEPHITGEMVEAVRQQLRECADPYVGLEQALECLALDGWVSNESVMVKDGNSALSGWGNALLASTLATIVTSRLKMAHGLVLIAIFLLSDVRPEDSAGETDESEILNRLISRVFVAFHRYNVLKSWVDSTGDEAAERSKLRSVGKRRAGDAQPRQPSSDRRLDADDFELDYSCAHIALTRDPSTGIERPAVNFASLATRNLGKTGLVPADTTDWAPDQQDVRFLCSVLDAELPMTAARLASLYAYSSGTAYITGRAYLEQGLIDEALRDFEAAVVAVEDGTLEHAFPSQDASDYFRHICTMFDEAGENATVAHFGQKILRLRDRADSSVRDVWTKVFLAYVKLGRFEEAYETMALCPHLDLRRDLLSQLISVMCEADEVGRLTGLGFVGLQKDVEQILSFKARNSDPLRFPNYYKVLYAWHVSRGDYRSAGNIMYMQGSRLGDALASGSTKMPVFEIRAMQARSYLASVNALSLVDKRNAWVAIPDNARRMSNKRKRTTSHIPSDEFSIDRQAVQLVTLADIEAEYRLSLASLQLSSHLEELQEHGVSITAEEIVGLLVQRNMFDLAQSAAATMEVDLTPIFVALATKCAELSRLSALSVDTPSAAWLQSSPLTSRLRGPPAALALRYLQIALSQHDSPKTQFRYREAVADELFEQNRNRRFGWQMPLWLVEWEMERDPEGWIGRALRHGWVKEAVDWTAQLLRDATPPELLPSGKADAAYVPYALVDRVMSAAGEGDEKEDKALQGRVKELRSTVQSRLAGLKQLHA